MLLSATHTLHALAGITEEVEDVLHTVVVVAAQEEEEEEEVTGVEDHRHIITNHTNTMEQQDLRTTTGECRRFWRTTIGC